MIHFDLSTRKTPFSHWFPFSLTFAHHLCLGLDITSLTKSTLTAQHYFQKPSFMFCCTIFSSCILVFNCIPTALLTCLHSPLCDNINEIGEYEFYFNICWKKKGIQDWTAKLFICISLQLKYVAKWVELTNFPLAQGFQLLSPIWASKVIASFQSHVPTSFILTIFFSLSFERL